MVLFNCGMLSSHLVAILQSTNELYKVTVVNPSLSPACVMPRNNNNERTNKQTKTEEAWAMERSLVYTWHSPSPIWLSCFLVKKTTARQHLKTPSQKTCLMVLVHEAVHASSVCDANVDRSIKAACTPGIREGRDALREPGLPVYRTQSDTLYLSPALWLTHTHTHTHT